MKKVFSILSVSIILASCGGNVSKFKPIIEEVSSKWDTTTSAVTEFSTMVKNEQATVLNLSNNLQIDPTTMQKWDEATTAKFNNIKAMVQSNSNELTSISTEVDSFVSSWIEKSKDLTALKEGLVSGKLEGDVQGKINALTVATTDAASKLNTWQEQFGKIKATVADISIKFSEFKGAYLQ